MGEFKIITSANEAVVLKPFKNQFASNPEFVETFGSVGDYGRMIFSKIKLSILTIWISYYKMFYETRFYAEIDQSLLEAHTTLISNMVHSIGRQTDTIFSSKEFNVTYMPYMENKAVFPKGGEYQTFDIHPSEKLLQNLSADFPELDRFLDKRIQDDQNIHQLFRHRNFLNIEMEAQISKIMQHLSSPICTRSLTEFLAGELLILLILRTRDSVPERYFNRNVEALVYAREIVEYEAGNYDDEDLFSSEIDICDRVGLSLFQLKSGFKRLFGMSLHRMGLELRIKKAEELMLDQQASVLDAALKTGFRSREGFSRAFKRIKGFPPSFFQNGRIGN